MPGLLLPQWREDFANWKQGLTSLRVVGLGDSIEEGFNAGASCRAADMWITRAGLKLAALRGESFAGRYLPSSTGAFSLGNFTWPEGADPWTRSGGALQSSSQGLGYRSVSLFGSNYSEIAAPASATHAVAYFASNGVNSTFEVSSNGSVIASGSTGTSATQQSIIIPLTGSGNAYRFKCVSSLGFMFFHGVEFLNRSTFSGILGSYSTSAGGFLGGTASVNIDPVVVGHLMLMVITTTNGNGTLPSTPAGWNSIDTKVQGGMEARLCWKTKVTGETAVVVGGGASRQTVATLGAWANATYDQVSASVAASTAGSSGTIDLPSLTATTGSTSLLFECFSTVVSTTQPSNWVDYATEDATGSAQSLRIAKRDGRSGAVDPPAISWSTGAFGTTDTIGWHVLLKPTSGGSDSYLSMVDAGHAGYSAEDYATDSGGTGGTFMWSKCLAVADPQLIILSLGVNDATGTSRTKAQFKADMNTTIAKADADCPRDLEYLLLMVPYIDGTTAGAFYTTSTWNGYKDAAQEIAATMGTRARYADASSVTGPWGTGDATGDTSTTDTFHPSAQAHRKIGDFVAGILAEGPTLPGSMFLSFP